MEIKWFTFSRSLYRDCLNSLFAIKSAGYQFLLCVKYKTEFFAFQVLRLHLVHIEQTQTRAISKVSEFGNQINVQN